MYDKIYVNDSVGLKDRKELIDNIIMRIIFKPYLKEKCIKYVNLYVHDMENELKKLSDVDLIHVFEICSTD